MNEENLNESDLPPPTGRSGLKGKMTLGSVLTAMAVNGKANADTRSQQPSLSKLTRVRVMGANGLTFSSKRQNERYARQGLRMVKSQTCDTMIIVRS